MFVLLTFPVVPNLLSLSTQRCRIDNNVSPLTPTPPPVFTAKGRPWERWTPWPWGIVRCWEWAERLGPLWKAVTGASQTGSLDHISTFRVFFRRKRKGHFWNGSSCLSARDWLPESSCWLFPIIFSIQWRRKRKRRVWVGGNSHLEISFQGGYWAFGFEEWANLASS